MNGELVERLEELRLFLNGEGPLDGLHFGEVKPVTPDRVGAFWWRRDMRATLDEAASEIVRLREVLERAERWFRDYERQHRAKGTLDGNLKADTNEERADYLRSALSPSVSDGGE